MTLLEDITNERADLENDVHEFADELLNKARRAVMNHGRFVPVVVAFIGAIPKVYDIGWRSAHERDKLMMRMNEKLAEDNATGSIFLAPGTSSDGNHSAICVMRRTPSGSDMTLYPYKHHDGFTIWGQPESLKRVDNKLLAVPALN